VAAVTTFPDTSEDDVVVDWKERLMLPTTVCVIVVSVIFAGTTAGHRRRQFRKINIFVRFVIMMIVIRASCQSKMIVLLIDVIDLYAMLLCELSAGSRNFKL
jgi:hypothetical protein